MRNVRPVFRERSLLVVEKDCPIAVDKPGLARNGRGKDSRS